MTILLRQRTTLPQVRRARQRTRVVVLPDPLQTAEGRWRRVAKPREDLVLGIALLVLTLPLPLMAAIAVAIRIDTPGLALFRQTRRGLNNSPFDILKPHAAHYPLNSHGPAGHREVDASAAAVF